MLTNGARRLGAGFIGGRWRWGDADVLPAASWTASVRRRKSMKATNMKVAADFGVKGALSQKLRENLGVNDSVPVLESKWQLDRMAVDGGSVNTAQSSMGVFTKSANHIMLQHNGIYQKRRDQEIHEKNSKVGCDFDASLKVPDPKHLKQEKWEEKNPGKIPHKKHGEHLHRPNPFHKKLPENTKVFIPEKRMMETFINEPSDVTNELVEAEVEMLELHHLRDHEMWGTDKFCHQWFYETRSVEVAIARYTDNFQKSAKRGAGATQVVASGLMRGWYESMKYALEREQLVIMKRWDPKLVEESDISVASEIGNKGQRGLLTYGPLILSLPAEKLAVIAMHEAMSQILRNPHKTTFLRVCDAVGSAVQAEFELQSVVLNPEKRDLVPYKYLKRLLKSSDHVGLSKTIARCLGKSRVWDLRLRIIVGAALLKVFLSTVNVTTKDQKVVPAFQHALKKLTGKEMWATGYISASKELLEELGIRHELFSELYPKQLPMVVKPIPWRSAEMGCYLKSQDFVMRTHGCVEQERLCMNRIEELAPVFEALQVLSETPWSINLDILDVVQKAWDRDLAIGDIPSQVDEADVCVASKTDGKFQRLSDIPDTDEFKHLKNELFKAIRKMEVNNANLHSLRCDMINKLHVAVEMAKHERFYLPHNLDFRGRAYPVPPHLNQMGNDLNRGLLKFADKRPLGKKGLFWLKVHLANLFGVNKMSLVEREKWTEERRKDIEKAALDPLSDEAMVFWLKADEPWQALATCIEITAAEASPHPEEYECSLPVHQDGSCNGLQHYAALGLDEIGGKQVNLVPGDLPSDPYTTVMKKVIEKVNLDAMETPGDDEENHDVIKWAKMLQGKIDRKVVKQTVMTTVYGVTLIGAKDQVAARLHEKYGDAGDRSMEEEDISKCSLYLAKTTLEAVGSIFVGASRTMDWLKAVAKMVSSLNELVSWTTPMGLKVVQPYKDEKPYKVVTVVQSVTLMSNLGMPPNKRKQTTAFPPNFVHSLDSTHMLMTAIEFKARGKIFAAVHDSYWTHACDVDLLAGELRTQFVRLYKQPILEKLVEELEREYPSIAGRLPPIPAKGNLDLEVVKKSTYFFS